MKVIIQFLAGFAFLISLQKVNGQTPFYPRPNIDNKIVFNRTIPPSLLSKLKKTETANTRPLDSSLSLYRVNRTHSPSDNWGAANTPTIPANTSRAIHPGHAGNGTGNFHLTRDINISPVGSAPGNANGIDLSPSFAVLNGIIYFAANDGIHGTELWRSDGTDAGTYMVKDIGDGPLPSMPTSITAANGKLFFSAFIYFSDEIGGREPWISDGTEEGTHKINNSGNPIFHNFDVIPERFVALGDKVFFDGNSYDKSDLFITDGTSSGTFLVHNFWSYPDPIPGYFRDITEPVAVNNLLFFAAGSPGHGVELWRSDGTNAGTFMVKDIGPDQGETYTPVHLTPYDKILYFSGDDGTGRRLWHSDGTEAGTQPATNPGNVFIDDYASFDLNTPFAVMDGILYFSGTTPADGGGLYKYDALDPLGVSLVKDLIASTDPAYISSSDLRVIDHTVFFKVISPSIEYHEELWVSDGTNLNTHVIKHFDPGAIAFGFYALPGKLYFDAYDPSSGSEPWISDGTAEGTLRLMDIFLGPKGSMSNFFTPFKGKVFFSAEDATIGDELWETDGTEQGTIPVKDINTSTVSSFAGIFTSKGIGSLENSVLFCAWEPIHGVELYGSDGTEQGTVLLNDIAQVTESSNPNDFLQKNGFGYFVADNLNGKAIYKSDGTAQGLQLIAQIIFNSDKGTYAVVEFIITDGGLPLYILLNQRTGLLELWRSDGTAIGTYSLSSNLFLNYGDYIVTVGNKGFFTADDGIHGPQVWVTDGTIAGTKMVKNINPSGAGSYPYSLFPYRNEVYFGAYDGIGYYNSLWKTDGTESGTQKVKDVTPAYLYYNYNLSDNPQVFCISGNTLFFSGVNYNSSPDDGSELWETKGGAQNTRLVKNINPIEGSNPSDLVDVDGTLYFLADDGTSGKELWLSQGREKDTKLVKDITPGSGGSNLGNLVSAGGKLYFLKEPGNSASTLWSADGAGNAGPVSDPLFDELSSIQALTAAGNKLFFSANSPKYGQELFVGIVGKDRSHFNDLRMMEEKTIVRTDPTEFMAELFPNPSSGPVYLQLKGAVQNAKISISGVDGETFWQTTVTKMSVIKLPAEKLPSGVYFISVISGRDQKVLKFVRQ